MELTQPAEWLCGESFAPPEQMAETPESSHSGVRFERHVGECDEMNDLESLHSSTRSSIEKNVPLTPSTPVARETPMYERASFSESHLSLFSFIELHPRNAPEPPPRDPIPQIPGRRYYSHALTEEDCDHLKAGDGVKPWTVHDLVTTGCGSPDLVEPWMRHETMEKLHMSSDSTTENLRKNLRRPSMNSLSSPPYSPQRWTTAPHTPSPLRESNDFISFDNLLQPHPSGEGEVLRSAAEPPKDVGASSKQKSPVEEQESREDMCGRLRKRIGKGAAAMKLRMGKKLKHRAT